MAIPSRSLLRIGHQADHRVQPMELFFDLVFVFAIIQLSHYLLDHLSIAGALQTGVMFLAVWWAWMYTAWATNWLDAERAPVRLVLAAVMLASLVLAACMKEAFGDYGLGFALAYCGIQVGRTAFTAWARGEWQSGASRNLTRATGYFLLSLPLWIAGALDVDPARRLMWWAGALAVEYSGPLLFFALPGLGRSTVAEWNISGEHMAERCALFVIIALGETILVMGGTFTGLDKDFPTVAAFVAAFVSTVAMWWIYFDVGARRGSAQIEHSDMPGLLGRHAYTYAHIPIVAGIVVLAVGDELVLTHPTGHAGLAYLIVLMTGAFLFIGGAGLFKRLTNPRGWFPLSHSVGLGGFALLGSWGWMAHPEPLTLALAASTLFVIIAVWEWVSFHGGWVERWQRLRAPSGERRRLSE
ncbi:MAG TPA: low temperature requirement protein A [Sphingomicrobium sp.]